MYGYYLCGEGSSVPSVRGQLFEQLGYDVLDLLSEVCTPDQGIVNINDSGMTPLGQSVVIGSCHETANVVNNRVGDHNLKRKECVHEQLDTVVSTKRCKTDSCQCRYSVCGEGSIVPNVGGE